MKNSSDTIGNRTRELLAGISVPQPTTPPRTPEMSPYSSVMLAGVVGNKKKLLSEEKQTDRNFHI